MDIIHIDAITVFCMIIYFILTIFIIAFMARKLDILMDRLDYMEDALSITDESLQNHIRDDE